MYSTFIHGYGPRELFNKIGNNDKISLIHATSVGLMSPFSPSICFNSIIMYSHPKFKRIHFLSW